VDRKKCVNWFGGRSGKVLDENWREEQRIVTCLIIWRGTKLAGHAAQFR